MQAADVLPTIAEMSITLAGFTGVLVAIRSSTSNLSSPDQMVRVGVVLIIPAMVLLCSILPFAISEFSSAPKFVWGVPLCVYGLTAQLMTLGAAYRVIWGGMKLTTPRVSWAMIGMGSAIHMLALLSGLGLLIPYSPGILVLGLTWNLLAAAFSLLMAVSTIVHPAAD